MWKVFLVLLICASCSAPQLTAHFCPHTNCTQLYETFNDAEPLCAFYKKDLESIKVLDENLLVESQTHTRGIPIKKKRGLMHHKFCVVGDTIITGSFNPARSELWNDNNVLHITSPTFARAFRSEWYRVQGIGSGVWGSNWENATHKYRLVFCQVQDCQKEVLHYVQQAENEIRFMLFSFTDKNIIEALMSSKVPVRGLMEKAGNKKTAQALNASHVALRWDEKKTKLHHKVWIIDDVVITGSYNPSQNGRLYNDEALFVIRDEKLLEQYNREFERLWNHPNTFK